MVNVSKKTNDRVAQISRICDAIFAEFIKELELSSNRKFNHVSGVKNVESAGYKDNANYVFVVKEKKGFMSNPLAFSISLDNIDIDSKGTKHLDININDSTLVPFILKLSSTYEHKLRDTFNTHVIINIKK